LSWPAQIDLAITGEDDAAFVGDLDITDALDILGNGASQTLIDGGQIDRVFHILNSSDVVIQGVAIQRGISSIGGGIFNEAGKLAVNASILRNNGASVGGGLANADDTSTEINESAIYENYAEYGGGIANKGGEMSVTNSTISGNFAYANGGGFYTAPGAFYYPHSYLTHLTIALNIASTGGGIYNDNSTVVVKNSICNEVF
jgi:hypothetical protein